MIYPSLTLHTVVALTALTPFALPAADTSASRPPNVIVILADDLGYGDVSAYGRGKLNTPNIDRLAAEGMRFTDGYAPASTCTPSRYGLLTGEYPWRKRGTGILQGDAKLIISPTRTTLASLFKNAGYATGAVGKWHLGLGAGDRPTDFNTHVRPGLNELGFTYAFHMAATGDRVPCVYMENGRVVGLDPKDPITVSYRKKVGDRPTLRELRGNPVAAYGETKLDPSLIPQLAKTMRMDSAEGHADTIINGIGRIGFMSGGTAALWEDRTLSDTFTDKALEFIDRHRNEPFFLYYAAHEPHVPHDPNPRFVGKSGLGPRGDAILQFDESVAKILAKLKEAGVDDHTLVILSSDNGPAVADGYLDGALPAETKAGHDASGGLRGRKYTDFEGGLRVPFLARWPGRIRAGSVSPAVVTLADLPALAADLTGAKLPADTAPDSFSFLPVLTGKAAVAAPFVILGNDAPAAIRAGKWKLLVEHSFGARKKAGPALYDLETDPEEKTDVAKSHPDVVARLAALHAQAVSDGFTRPGAQAVEIR